MIKFFKRSVLRIVFYAVLLSFCSVGFSRAPDLTLVEDVNRVLSGQLQKLSVYQKNAKLVQDIGIYGIDSTLVQTRCKRFWNLLARSKSIQMPTPIFAQKGDSGKRAAVKLIYNIALSNKKNIAEGVELSKENIKDFFELRYSKKFVNELNLVLQDFEDKVFTEEDFFESLVTDMMNPLTITDRLEDAPALNFDPIYLIYKNRIPLEKLEELAFVTVEIRENGNVLSLAHNGLDHSGSLAIYMQPYGYYFGVEDIHGSFDEATYLSLLPYGVLNSRGITSPSILNGLIQMDGLLLFWTLKNINDISYDIEVTDAGAKINADFVLIVGDIVNKYGDCSIVFQ